MSMISIIIPTYNEKENIGELIQSIRMVFESGPRHDYEILVMDDNSPDGTAQAVQELADPRVKVVIRDDRQRGLSAAVIDGMKEARGDYLAVMDADLSHPPHILRALADALDEGNNIAVASRYIQGGGIENWPWHRLVTSRIACFLGRRFTKVRDCTSGFFMIRKDVLDIVHLNSCGFKIGLEVFVKSRHGNKIKEVPYIFKDRTQGRSKLSLKVIWQYIRQLGIFLGKAR